MDFSGWLSMKLPLRRTLVQFLISRLSFPVERMQFEEFYKVEEPNGKRSNQKPETLMSKFQRYKCHAEAVMKQVDTTNDQQWTAAGQTKISLLYSQ
jgi:hypothetical protein